MSIMHYQNGDIPETSQIISTIHLVKSYNGVKKGGRSYKSNNLKNRSLLETEILTLETTVNQLCRGTVIQIKPLFFYFN